MRRFFISNEAVAEGHPDKIADQIADAVLDEMIKQDRYGRCACEVMVGDNYAVVGGEINSIAWINYNNLVRKIIRDIGYDRPELGFYCKSATILNTINRQSAEIAKLVRRSGSKKQGAGDQGIVTGYASNETPELMPLGHMMAQRLAMGLAQMRRKKAIPNLRPDGKCQITLEYKDGAAHRLEDVIISAQHDPAGTASQIKHDLIDKVIKPICGKYLDKDTKIFINQSGRFVTGGPVADTGVTGRKTVSDSYGSTVPLGGGCLSGKDPTKIDRSGAYMARYIAKNIVAAGLASECFIRLSYMIGDTKPTEFSVETFGSYTVDEEIIEKAILKIFDLSPGGIIRQLKLLRPIYRQTTNYGHFGREEPGFTWEKKDKVKDLLREVEKASKTRL